MQLMNLYKHGPSYWCRFTSHKGKICKLRATRNKRTAEVFARNLAALVDAASVGAAISDDLLDWVGALDAKRIERLVQWELIDEKRMAVKETIYQQMDRWLDGLLNRGRSEAEANKRHRRAKAVAEACGWRHWRDVDAETALACIEGWRRDGAVPGYNRKTTVSERTLAHYLAAIKQFTRWMMLSGYATKDPLAPLSVEHRKPRAGAVPSNMAKRRPLTDGEQWDLIATTRSSETISHGMLGVDRALLYRIALQTGLRASAIQRLRCRDVLTGGWLMARSGGAKNKKTTPKPIRGLLLDLLVAKAGAGEPDDPIMHLPPGCEWARMLRADCEAAGIDTEGVDFHCLRHTFGTTLARQGVHPKTLMSLMDHSDINMTMRLYTHSMPGDELAAMDLLPDLDGVGGENREKVA